MKTAVLTVILLILVGAGFYINSALRKGSAGGSNNPLLAAAAAKGQTGSIPVAAAEASASGTSSVHLISADLTKIAGGPMLSFNFDDGVLSTYENAIPIFNAAGFKTTQYIITGAFDKANYVNKQQVLEMYAEGHEIGAHTRTHPYLTKLSVAQMTDEIEGSKQDLSAMGITPTTFAYPYGDENATVERIVKQAGFAGARITQPEFDDSSTDPFLLRRQRIQANTSFAEVKNAIDNAIKEKKWIILVMHGIDTGDGKAGSEDITPAMLRQIVDYVKQVNIPVVTTAEGLQVLKTIK